FVRADRLFAAFEGAGLGLNERHGDMTTQGEGIVAVAVERMEREPAAFDCKAVAEFVSKYVFAQVLQLRNQPEMLVQDRFEISVNHGPQDRICIVFIALTKKGVEAPLVEVVSQSIPR